MAEQYDFSSSEAMSLLALTLVINEARKMADSMGMSKTSSALRSSLGTLSKEANDKLQGALSNEAGFNNRP